jgi:hypothetical protein
LQRTPTLVHPAQNHLYAPMNSANHFKL